MNLAGPAVAENQPSTHRRRLLWRLLGFPLLVPAVLVAGCANRQPLPPERRTRGRFGNRDRPGEGGGNRD